MGCIDWASSCSLGIGPMNLDRVGTKLKTDYRLLPWPRSLVSAFMRKGQKGPTSLMGLDDVLSAVDTAS